MTALSNDATIGEIRTPVPGGQSYIYRGNGRWDIHVNGTVTSSAVYYTKVEIDASQAAQNATITAASTAATSALSAASAAIPVSQKSAANGVASLDASGFVPLAQLGNTPTAPVASVAGKTGVVALAKADVGLGNVDNTSDFSKPISTATQTALNAKQATIGFTPANAAGQAFTGPVTAATALTIAGAAGSFRQLIFSSVDSLRWNILTTNSSESSSSTGSDLAIYAYTNAGTFYGIPFAINRQSLVCNFSNWPTVNGAQFPRSVNGIAADGAGNISLGVNQVRLGAEATVTIDSDIDARAAYAHSVTGLRRNSDTGAITGIHTRPVQQLYGTIWYTVAQV